MTRINTEASLSQLYEQDFALWIETTVAQLEARNTENLDWENLIEEVASLGKSQKRELESRLRILLTHLLKRCYVSMPECYRGWVDTIDEQRSELELLLKQSPSLNRYFIDVIDPAFDYALRKVRCDYPDTQFPERWQFSREIEALLSESFWD
ncbi:MAG: DUF29 domain-containing protein [Cyanobacteria bacterium CRU_2_1]|nr:DUF29 domain-containing protein [Cyanobacteria bacterium RU_5_0]NJR62106.1 DUF29 domain-containing protein [Cyanobacteria bacterium CRU_2_1]